MSNGHTTGALLSEQLISQLASLHVVSRLEILPSADLPSRFVTVLTNQGMDRFLPVALSRHVLSGVELEFARQRGHHLLYEERGVMMTHSNFCQIFIYLLVE
ncbi:hypothetical protein AVEN_226302-1 [Araneus ventricosus]|uniref:Uncharacterized protein n=1 Tax=Araneus ventricosus TaxID=182803 RepID=A0A4Y2D9F1_ARAVE|nr:hypothetical protein AVEN_226302-1 [Araneus ventricosus]